MEVTDSAGLDVAAIKADFPILSRRIHDRALVFLDSADLILHVRDISHPDAMEQAADVADILTSLGVGDDTPLIEVWNKLDAVPPGALCAGLPSCSPRGR